MQLLDEEGLSPYKTFDSISKFAELLARCRGEAFDPRISRHKITDNTEIILIEPACGSNTAIIKSGGEYLFIDTGYAMYKEEMTYIFRKYIEGFDDMEKKVFVTHADLDHCGLLPMFDKVYASKKTAKCLELEYRKGEGYRAENKFHRPYIEICRTLTLHKGVEPSKVIAAWGSEEPNEAILTQIGFFDFGEMHFEVYEGKGGHLPGEIVLIDYSKHIAITGDIYINTHGLTAEQAEYNQYAPILMTSVDTDPKLCLEERKAIMQRLGVGNWQIFGAHGFKKEYSVNL
jgi:glyoxylase-like metal-dependent hydrolase (beta-lactamase superfamily II)